MSGRRKLDIRVCVEIRFNIFNLNVIARVSDCVFFVIVYRYRKIIYKYTIT